MSCSKKRKFVPEPQFEYWPPENIERWEKERKLRISPVLNSLVHHHPDELVEVLLHLIHFDEQNADGNPIAVRVKEILITQLPLNITPLQLSTFVPQTLQERVYCRRLVLEIRDIGSCYPFNLFKIIVALVDDVQFPMITEEEVVRRIKHITCRQSAIRGKIRSDLAIRGKISDVLKNLPLCSTQID